MIKLIIIVNVHHDNQHAFMMMSIMIRILMTGIIRIKNNLDIICACVHQYIHKYS
jgi:hypothetical protein